MRLFLLLGLLSIVGCGGDVITSPFNGGVSLDEIRTMSLRDLTSLDDVSSVKLTGENSHLIERSRSRLQSLHQYIYVFEDSARAVRSYKTFPTSQQAWSTYFDSRTVSGDLRLFTQTDTSAIYTRTEHQSLSCPNGKLEITTSSANTVGLLETSVNAYISSKEGLALLYKLRQDAINTIYSTDSYGSLDVKDMPLMNQREINRASGCPAVNSDDFIPMQKHMHRRRCETNRLAKIDSLILSTMSTEFTAHCAEVERSWIEPKPVDI